MEQFIEWQKAKFTNVLISNEESELDDEEYWEYYNRLKQYKAECARFYSNVD